MTLAVATTLALMTLLPLRPATSAPDRVTKGSLSIADTGATMQPVNATARVARVAVVPNSPEDEAWGVGLSYAHKPGFDQVQFFGQVVFMRYTRSTGWQVQGPPLDENGKAENNSINALAMLPSGEGWAVGVAGSVYHRIPGEAWRKDGTASYVSSSTNYSSISLGSDSSGVYGWAVGDNLGAIRFDGSSWSLDSVTSVVAGQTLPRLTAVTSSSRQSAWAVSSRTDALEIYERSAAGWTRRLTGIAMFDSPPAPAGGSGSGSLNQFAAGSGISAADDAVWITGRLQPFDAATSAGDDVAPRRERPFALRLDRAQEAFTSFCPRVYRLSNNGVNSTVEVCDRDFPLTIGDLPVIAAFSGGRALAGGFGFFSFSSGSWKREANVAGYLVSGSFSSFTQGWTASSGDVYSTEGNATSSTVTLGHWTSKPAAERMRRWPVAVTEALESVAIEPVSNKAVAVGGKGTIVHLDHSAGWDALASPTSVDLHSVAWAEPGKAWAVGEDGTIIRYDGSRWTLDAASGKATGRDLHSVVFTGAGRGFAFGDKGTILVYQNQSWSPHSSSGKVPVRLNSAASSGEKVIAAGDKGVLLESSGDSFIQPSGLAKQLEYGTEFPKAAANLLSVASLGDGSFLVGGSHSALITRSTNGAYQVGSDYMPVEGSIHTLAASRAAGGEISVVASTGRAKSRFGGAGIVEAVGWPYASRAKGWIDISPDGRKASIDTAFDAPAQADPVFGVALDSSGKSGWAVGGYRANLLDEDGHLPSTSSASIWKIDLDRTPPASPSQIKGRLDVPQDAVNFAYIGDTACSTSLCSVVGGTGTRADEVWIKASQQISSLAGVSFVMHGGDMRRNGFPDELAPVKEMLAEMPIPVFGAVGDKDLFSGLTTSLLPSITEKPSILPSSGYFLDVFATAPAPWGRGAPPAGSTPVPGPGDDDVRRSRARTFYAFDQARSGSSVRVIVLDTSRTPLASNAYNQNPPTDQLAWLSSVLASAGSQPVVVVMHNPLVLPIGNDLDSSAITGLLVQAGADAVLASGERRNLLVDAPSSLTPAFKVGVFGGGGGPLAGGARIEEGAYHSWQLVSVKPQGISIKSIPVVESAALHASGGRVASAGTALRFTGIARLPDSGVAHSQGSAMDSEQSRASYLRLPLPPRCALLQAVEGCMAADAAPPDHRFSCEDPSICAFVKEDPSRQGVPLRGTLGELIPDATGGFMCTFRPGRTAVRLDVGMVAARVPFEVRGGGGPCIPGIISIASDDSPVGSVLTDPEAALVPDKQEFRPLIGGRLPEGAAIAAVPPPIINPAPAPPGGGGSQREEEHQAAQERSNATALARGLERRNAAFAGIATAMCLFASAITLAIVFRPKPRPRTSPQYIRKKGTR